jgi:hypothetical protein
MNACDPDLSGTATSSISRIHTLELMWGLAKPHRRFAEFRSGIGRREYCLAKIKKNPVSREPSIAHDDGRYSSVRCISLSPLVKMTKMWRVWSSDSRMWTRNRGPTKPRRGWGVDVSNQ